MMLIKTFLKYISSGTSITNENPKVFLACMDTDRNCKDSMGVNRSDGSFHQGALAICWELNILIYIGPGPLRLPEFGFLMHLIYPSPSSTMSLPIRWLFPVLVSRAGWPKSAQHMSPSLYKNKMGEDHNYTLSTYLSL